jgi:hypothetical protein
LTVEFRREPIEAGKLPPNLERATGPDAPGPMKMMAARGMLPAGPEESLLLLYSLRDDDDQRVVSEVVKSVADLPQDILLSAVGGLTHEGVLDWLMDQRRADDRVVESILLNQRCHDSTVLRIAKTTNANISDLIATNQVRVLRCPEIIEGLYVNPNTRMATVDRLVDLARRNEIELKGLPALKEAMQSERPVFAPQPTTEGRQSETSQEEPDEEWTGPADQDLDMFASLLQSEAVKAVKEEAGEKVEEAVEEDSDDSEEVRNLALKIAQMGTSQKIRLAIVGSRSAIAIMVRDSNKLVHMAAVRSPRVRYADARKWSKNKSLPDGVISYIAGNRDWTRHYEVQCNLVANPKTPLSDAMSFVKRLRTNDLKQLSKNRNVPHQVARMAKSLYERRSSGQR